jgi:hypothetical protein
VVAPLPFWRDQYIVFLTVVRRDQNNWTRRECLAELQSFHTRLPVLHAPLCS